MSIPYIFTTLFYTFVGLFIAADASLVSFNLTNAFPALRWVRVHFITLGILSQVIFGLLPALVAGQAKKPRPAMRWDIWLLLNAGFALLIAGFSSMNHPLIFAGGTLVFIAASLLLVQLWNLRGGETPASLKFYTTGVAYLLLGIILGTGIFLNWSTALRIRVPLEVHIHANSWGFMSLVFAGLLVDFIPMITGKPLGEKKAIDYIFWSMTLGAFGIILGPWIPASISEPPTVAGLVLHLSGTVWLVVLMIRALKASGHLSQAGGWHLVASYAWILMPVLVAPTILLKLIPSGPVESTAPQPLIYGWVFQFGIALIPYIFRRYLLKEKNPALGGSWLTLALLTLGGLIIWISIFSPIENVLYGIGFMLYTIAFIQPLKELLDIVRKATVKFEEA